MLKRQIYFILFFGSQETRKNRIKFGYQVRQDLLKFLECHVGLTLIFSTIHLLRFLLNLGILVVTLRSTGRLLKRGAPLYMKPLLVRVSLNKVKLLVRDYVKITHILIFNFQFAVQVLRYYCCDNSKHCHDVNTPSQTLTNWLGCIFF